MLMNSCKRIFLIGHPGAGKGLLAKSLAQRLGWTYIDADLGLESRIGASIDDILGKGTQDFMGCQYQVLADICQKEHVVVTTDASIVCSEQLRELLSQEFTVYLQVSLEVQMERTNHQAALLKPGANRDAFFKELHETRDVLYESIAKLNISSDNSKVDEHINDVIKFISVVESDKTKALDEKELTFFHKTLHTPVKLGAQQAMSLKYLAQGLSAKEIARNMQLSNRTVEGTLAKVMELLGCTNSKELIALYHKKP